MVRVATWNVNGLRAVVKKYGSLSHMLELLQADIVCVQETKLTRSELTSDLAVCDGWDSYFSSCRTRQGYSGVATFCRSCVSTPSWAGEGLGAAGMANTGADGLDSDCFEGWLPEELEEIDQEGRVVMTDHGAFVLVNLYGPALSMEERVEERLKYKLKFYKALELRMRRLQQAGRHVVVVGDFNISPKPIDHCDPSPGFCQRQDRRWLLQLLASAADPNENHDAGPIVDVFRCCHPQRPGAFTCWNVSSGAKKNNYGTRIDLILAAAPAGTSHAALCSIIRNSDIFPQFEGSDHAPCHADLEFIGLHTDLQPAAISMRHVFKGRQTVLWNMLAKGKAQRGEQPTCPEQVGTRVENGGTAENDGSDTGARKRVALTSTAAPRKVQRGIGAFLTGWPAKTSGTTSDGGRPSSDCNGSLDRAGSTAPLPSSSSGLRDGVEKVDSAVQPYQRDKDDRFITFPKQSVGSAADGPWLPPEDASRAWLKIQSRMAPPPCQGHREPCAVRVVKKAGPNQGRVFFVCDRSAGKPPEGRCNHFQWANHRMTKGR